MNLDELYYFGVTTNKHSYPDVKIDGFDNLQWKRCVKSSSDDYWTILPLRIIQKIICCYAAYNTNIDGFTQNYAKYYNNITGEWLNDISNVD